MGEFLETLFLYPFLQNALLAGFLISPACGVMGTFVVVKRISYLVGAIAHSVLAGLGFIRYLQVVKGWVWIEPIWGALFVGVLAAFILGIVRLKVKEREDSIIGAIWTIGFAIGLLFISITPEFDADLMSYLFGNILMVSSQDLWLMFVLDIFILFLVLVFYYQITAICFDEEFAFLQGLRVELYFFMFLVLTAVTVVMLSKVVGIVMVISLLTLPAAIGSHLGKELWHIMGFSTFFSIFFTTVGLYISYYPNLPSGAVIVILGGIVYLLTVLWVWLQKRGRI